MAQLNHITVNTEYVFGDSPWANDTYTTLGGQTVVGTAAEPDRIIDYIKSTVIKINAMIDDINSNDLNYETLLQGHTDAIQGLGSDITVLNANVTVAQQQLNTLQGDLQTLANTVSTNTADITVLKNQYNTIQIQVQSALDIIEAVRDALEGLNQTVRIYGYVDSVGNLPTSLAEDGDIYGIGTQVVGAELVQDTTSIWMPIGIVDGQVATFDDLPDPDEEYLYYVVGSELYKSETIYEDDGAGGYTATITWILQGDFSGLVADESALPIFAPTENNLLFSRVDRIVAVDGDKPAAADEYFVCAVDSTLNLTASSTYYCYVNGGWITLPYKPNYLTYAYHNGAWQKIGEHDVNVDRFLKDVQFVVNPDGQAPGTYIEFTFDTESGDQMIYLDVSGLGYEYFAGNGLLLTGNTFSVKIKTGSHLQVTSDGLGFEDGFGAISNEEKDKLDDLPDITLAQTTGQSTTAVMSQKAVTDAFANYVPPTAECPYDIDDIYTTVSANYNTAAKVAARWPGTSWAAWGADRALVGVGSTYAVNQEFGANSVSLTEANLASHAHTSASHSHSMPHTHNVAAQGTGSMNANHYHSGAGIDKLNVNTSASGYGMQSGSSSYSGRVAITGGATGAQGYLQAYETYFSTDTGYANADHQHEVGAHTTGGVNTSNTTATTPGNTGSTGSGTAHENRQPSKAAYMWRRVA